MSINPGDYGARDNRNLPARRGSTSTTRFPESQENKPVYANITSKRPRTEYVYLQNQGGGGGGGRWTLRWIPPARKAQHGPTWVPSILTSDKVLLYSWLAAMMVIAVDEWHNNGILPRPARLWWTSLTYFLLMGVGMVDVMIPLVNALGIGFFMVLIYQYNTGAGQFAKSSTAGG